MLDVSFDIELYITSIVYKFFFRYISLLISKSVEHFPNRYRKKKTKTKSGTVFEFLFSPLASPHSELM